MDWKALLDEHGSALILYARHWTHCHADAEDVVHDAIAKLHRTNKVKDMRSQLREQTMDELQKKLSDLEEQLFKLRFQKSTGQIENPQKIREVRKDIARVQTVMNERLNEESAS